MPEIQPITKPHATVGVCPACGSTATSGEQYEPDGNSIKQDCSCDDCDHQWVDTFNLVSQG